MAELRKLGRDLDVAFRAATTCGFISSDHGEFGKLVARLSPIHKGLVARYVPDAPVINLPGPMLVLKLLADHLSDVERQWMFEVILLVTQKIKARLTITTPGCDLYVIPPGMTRTVSVCSRT